MKIGAQLYSLKDFIQTENDMEFTFDKLAKMNCEVAQLSGLNAYDPKKVREIADKNGIQIVLTHTDQGKVLNDIDNVIETHKILGAEFIGIGSVPGKYRTLDFSHRFAEDYIPVAEKIKAAGMKFMYHHHDFEFEKLGDTNLMQILLADMPADLMGFTLDTYWLQSAGVDVLQWIDILQDRIPCVHLKDMAIVDRQHRFAPIYEGNMNFDGILQKLIDLGKTEYALIELDKCYGASPFESMKTSLENIKKHGF